MILNNEKEFLIKYSGYFLALLGFGFGYLQYILRRRHEKNDKLVEKRYEVYKEYITKLDQIQENMTNINFDEFIKTIKVSMVKILDNPSDQQPIIDLQNKLYETNARSTKALYQAFQELTGIELIASTDLKNLLKIYKDVILSTSDEIQKTAEKINFLQPDMNIFNEIQTIADNNKELLIGLKASIIDKMRKEIGVRD